jgi:hypothetical protein
MIPVSYFQNPDFRKKNYLRKATELTLRLLDEMKLTDDEGIEICSSFLFDETRRELLDRYGEDRVRVAVITGEAQHNVETAYLDEIRNLGYEPLPERDMKRARSFHHMLRWVRKNPEHRMKYAKTGWPKLRRYIQVR